MSSYGRYTLGAVLLALSVTGVALYFGSHSVGGADSYGYASQADAWLNGGPILEQPWVHQQDVLPFSERAFAPLGWRLRSETTIVPIYSTGLPLIMAGAKAIGGHGAIFTVVPLLAGLLTFATYLMGVRFGRPAAGLLAAAFVGSSATVLFMSIAPMSDVPSAALWTFAMVMTLAHTRRAALIAGLVAALAILVRPNLVALSVLMTLWLVTRDWAEYRAQWRQWCAPWFACTSAVGILVNAYLNYRFYGSALTSGYGDLSRYYEWGHVWPNLKLYFSWLGTAESVLAPVAFAATICPIVLWRCGGRARQAAWLLALSTAYVWSLYCGYLVFADWWYLRFMLPVWPALALTGALALSWLWQRSHIVSRSAAVIIAIAVIVHGVVFAYQHDAFSIGLTESRYPAVARAVSGMTDRSAAIITVQHSGSLRYYGGRVTLRWDFIEPDQMALAVAWLAAHGHRPYVLIDRGELEAFRRRFEESGEVSMLNWTPSLTMFGGDTLLFDLADRDRETRTTRAGTYSRRTIPPAPPPHW